MRYQRAVGYAHVFTSEEREVVVSGANLAVGNMHVPADDAVDPVVVGKQQAVQDVYARDHGPVAVAEVKCPVGAFRSVTSRTTMLWQLKKTIMVPGRPLGLAS